MAGLLSFLFFVKNIAPDVHISITIWNRSTTQVKKSCLSSNSYINFLQKKARGNIKNQDYSSIHCLHLVPLKNGNTIKCHGKVVLSHIIRRNYLGLIFACNCFKIPINSQNMCSYFRQKSGSKAGGLRQKLWLFS